MSRRRRYRPCLWNVHRCRCWPTKARWQQAHRANGSGIDCWFEMLHQLLTLPSARRTRTSRSPLRGEPVLDRCGCRCIAGRSCRQREDAQISRLALIVPVLPRKHQRAGLSPCSSANNAASRACSSSFRACAAEKRSASRVCNAVAVALLPACDDPARSSTASVEGNGSSTASACGQRCRAIRALARATAV